MRHRGLWDLKFSAGPFKHLKLAYENEKGFQLNSKFPNASAINAGGEQCTAINSGKRSSGSAAADDLLR